MTRQTSRPACVLTTLALTVSLGFLSRPSASGQGPEKPRESKALEFVVESYYRAQWGHAEEFLSLYKKNHLPVLRKLQEEGRIHRIEAAKPRYHSTEDSRWDYRVTLTFRDASAAHDPAREDAVKKQLYADQDTFRKEEQRRFEILDSHWDVVVDGVDLDAK
jgi:EthD domain